MNRRAFLRGTAGIVAGLLVAPFATTQQPISAVDFDAHLAESASEIAREFNRCVIIQVTDEMMLDYV